MQLVSLRSFAALIVIGSFDRYPLFSMGNAEWMLKLESTFHVSGLINYIDALGPNAICYRMNS